MTDRGDGGGKDQGGADAAEDAEDEDEMPVCYSVMLDLL